MQDWILILILFVLLIIVIQLLWSRRRTNYSRA